MRFEETYDSRAGGDAVGLSCWTNRSWPFRFSISFWENVCRRGDFSGAVLDRWSFFDRGTDAERGDGDGTGLLRVLGKSDSRGDGDGITGDVARRCSL